MKLLAELSDESVLKEIGHRLTRTRLERNLTQAQLAEIAGVSKRTLERLESGAAATQLTSFIRTCRSLGLLERLDLFLPTPEVSPVEQLKFQGRKRKRASGSKAKKTSSQKWSWE
jgi:transcriptional regulator with XRE-family HTH domain